jgi:gas vesicle protein
MQWSINKVSRNTDHERDGFADAGAFVLGALVGGAVAGIVMLLNAPRSGAETRSDIRQRGLDLRVQAEQAAAAAREKVQGPDAALLINDAKAAARQYKETQG